MKAFSQASGQTLYDADGDINDTITIIQRAYQIGIDQLAADVSHLRGKNTAETAANIWHYVRENTRYLRDQAGFEDVKTPARTQTDGFGDCEDMTIQAAVLAQALGYVPYANIIEQNNNGWSHIFLTIGDRPHPDNPKIIGYAIDAVPEIPGPDAIAPNITRVMRIRLLNGVESQSKGLYLHGLGGVLPVDTVTQSLQDRRDILLALYEARTSNPGGWTATAQKELRKVLALIQMNATPERNKMLPLMAEIDDVTDEGVWIFKRDADLQGIAEYLDDDDDALGAIFQKRTQSAAVAKAQAAPQKQGGKVKQAAQKVAKAVVKYNPATLAMRGGVLLALKLNLFKLASKLQYLYWDLEGATNADLNVEALKRFQKKRPGIEAIWTKIGGDVMAFRRAIGDGVRLGNKHAQKRNNRKNLNGLGVVETAALVAGAATLAAIAKEIGPDGMAALKDLFANSKNPDLDAVSDLPSDSEIDAGLKAASEGATNNPTDSGFTSQEQQNAARAALQSDDQKSNNTNAYLGIALGLAAVGWLVFKK
jgi:hypothetical protein